MYTVAQPSHTHLARQCALSCSENLLLFYVLSFILISSIRTTNKLP